MTIKMQFNPVVELTPSQVGATFKVSSRVLDAIRDRYFAVVEEFAAFNGRQSWIIRGLNVYFVEIVYVNVRVDDREVEISWTCHKDGNETNGIKTLVNDIVKGVVEEIQRGEE